MLTIPFDHAVFLFDATPAAPPKKTLARDDAPPPKLTRHLGRVLYAVLVEGEIILYMESVEAATCVLQVPLTRARRALPVEVAEFQRVRDASEAALTEKELAAHATGRLVKPRRALNWGPKPHSDGTYARIEVGVEAHVVQGSGGWLAYVPALLSPPIGVYWPSEEKAKQAVEEHAAQPPSPDV